MQRLGFVTEREMQVEGSPWGPHEWLCRPGLTDAHDLLLVRVRMPPGRAHQFHRHPEMEEIIYVLSGTAEQWVDTEKRNLREGDIAHIPRNMVHGTYNAGADTLVFLAILSPARISGPAIVDVHEEEPWRSLKAPMVFGPASVPAHRRAQMKAVLLIGTLDTKGEEYAFVRDLVLARGHKVLAMDLSVLGEPPFPPDITAENVAEAAGTSLKELRSRGDRGSAVEIMMTGARKLARRWFAEGRFDGVLGLGGGGGTTMITAAMRELPVGVPKLMVSTMASGNTAPYVDVKDITLMYSVVDIAGLNPLSRRILANAAGAICGMMDESPQAAGRRPQESHKPDRPLIAATMFGVTTPCVTEARKRLEQEGYEVLVFHATGSGGRAMEGLIADGYFAGVLDVTTTEWCDEVVGGVLSAGSDRLSAAGNKGIPQVVSVGALDMVNFGAVETVPERFRGRRLYKHNPTVTLMRTTASECWEIGRRIAEQLNRARGPVVLMMPLRGVSMIDAEGQPFHDRDADRALFDALLEHVAPNVRVRELDAHINDPEFAHALADELLTLLAKTGR